MLVESPTDVFAGDAEGCNRLPPVDGDVPLRLRGVAGAARGAATAEVDY